MRDAHRMKEKLDLSLDNRQIVSLGVASIVVLGAVFVLGVVVGKKLSESGRTESATDILAALDEKKAAMEAMESADSDPQLTFQKVLTENEKNEKVSVVTLPPPAPKPEPVKAPEPAPVNVPEPEVVVAAEKPEPTKAEPPVVVASQKVPAEGRVEQVEVAARTKTSSVAEAIAKMKPQPAVPTAAKGNFTLQLSAAPSRAEADRFAQNLKGKGYAPYVVEAEVPGKGIWYRVRLGKFPSREAAQRYLTDFRRETQLEAFVATVQ